MNNSSYDDLSLLIERFNKKHPRPHGQVALSDLIEIIPGTSAEWPSNGLPGVYVFLDNEKLITYIGKASSDIGLRLSARFDTKWNSKTTESAECKYITTISLPNEVGFEAPSIEEYLLNNLKTRFNTTHNG